MSWKIYGILVIFGLFVLLLIFNPNLSCFGRKIRSPFYPVFRKRRQKKIKTEDYGFHLVDNPQEKKFRRKKETIKTEDYGFNFEEDREKFPPEGQGKGSERN